ncbi:helicase-related protein [Streptomyces sp. WMMC1477]|uniref:helicase-related protein n=1 Tax=Streptomyces sp. WMMC1477 TaxID=3015155 RepID=UPI0022B6B8F1|nr:helicase-related protein [Streptomyces sp. WMMC1477]MCZ7434509.1 helicase-related protein [Streptomyces sp. WMMC1477]
MVTVVAAVPTVDGADLVVRRSNGTLTDVVLGHAELRAATVPANDGRGDPGRALAGLWGWWMQYAVPRIRSAVLATRPLRPYAHQDEAVFSHMLAQPRLRFLLADEPGTGKTIMTGMYIAEGTRRGLVPGRTIIVVPAHLVAKWQRDLRRYFAIEAATVTGEIARSPRDLDPRVSVWVASLDLYTHNADVRRTISGARASWSLAVFDEAHRLTPTSQYLGAAREVANRSHHLLLLTATPHRGKEHYFRALLNLLDPTLYPWDPRQSEYDRALKPSTLSFLRRMKEELKGFDGTDLFPPRFAETVPVDLSGPEVAAYTAVMDYVDAHYGENATLARSIYGKRAASSLVAAAATVRRRAEALKGPASGRTGAVVPEEFARSNGTVDLGVEDDEAWQRAEEALVRARSRDKGSELMAVDGVLAAIEQATASGLSTKWLRTQELLAVHGIAPGQGQLLVFTEFADTARWLAERFDWAGYSVEVLQGAVGHHERDRLQQRFLTGQFQVLVSTDAGGEGIDLQSAHVMINWDIPWSLVRLEQRMGRLHRIGQSQAVHIYHLVAPQTREGRVQEVMLGNLQAAGESLDGRIFDLMDATADRAGFDYTRALTEAQAGRDVAVPAVATLLATAKELVRDENRLHTPANTEAALERFRSDRLEAINPVIVDGFVDQLAFAEHWRSGPGPAKGIRHLSATRLLPPALGGTHEALVAADGSSVRKAVNDGAQGLDDVVVLGPTEEPFHELTDLALRIGESDLVRGTVLTDPASLTDYTLLVYDAEVEIHDGIRRRRRKSPVLIRYSGAGAFESAWESLMLLAPSGTARRAAPPLSPALRHDAEQEARAALAREAARARAEREVWVDQARRQLDQVEYRYLDELEDLPAPERRERMARFGELKRDRLAQLDDISRVGQSAPRLVGWAYVVGEARADQLGYDPDSEAVAVAAVLAELERLGFDVDDRQSAGVGYDLLARHRTTREQRLVEVKGLQAGLAPVWLEQHEWAQAQQRGQDYWLYVVVDCATAPAVAVRVQDPAGLLASGPRRIERFQIKVADLRRLMGEQR